MYQRQLKLLWLLSIRENGLLILRKMASYIFPSTRIAKEALKEKIILDRLLSQGYKVTYDGPGNIVQLELNSRRNVINASLRRYSSDHMVFDQILIHEEYQALVNYIRKYGSEHDIHTIVDAGANIGLTTLYLKVYFPSAKVYCIEPDSNNYKALCKNLRLNQLNEINVIHGAVWHKNEMLLLSNNFRDGKDWSISVKNINEESDPVNMVKGITFAELMKQNNLSHIDILKIDIEGAERYIFSSIQDCETFLPFTKYLAMEIHDEFGILNQVKNILGYFDFEYFFAGELIIAKNRKL